MLKHYADTTRKPDTMTSDERRDEVAGILARGLVRALQAITAADAGVHANLAQDVETCLELPSVPGLSVSPRPAGEGPGLGCSKNEEPR